jgi:fatty acid desaturase
MFYHVSRAVSKADAVAVAHDASHGATTSSPSVNFALSFFSVPWTYNTIPWFIQHVMQHHV